MRTGLRTLFVSLILCLIGSPLFSASKPLRGKRIIVDPGHGTIDFNRKIINGGKITLSGTPEHKLTLAISNKLAVKLAKQGADVYITRATKDYWRLAPNSVDDNRLRAVLANEIKGDVLLSVHCDWHPNRSIHGVTTLYAKSKSIRLGELIHRSLVTKLKAKDRKVKRDKFTVLDNADMPAIIIETGFMSNPVEYKKLESETYQEKIASAITAGLIKYFN